MGHELIKALERDGFLQIVDGPEPAYSATCSWGSTYIDFDGRYANAECNFPTYAYVCFTHTGDATCACQEEGGAHQACDEAWEEYVTMCRDHDDAYQKDVEAGKFPLGTGGTHVRV